MSATINAMISAPKLRPRTSTAIVLCAVMLAGLNARLFSAELPRVFPEGVKPADGRIGHLKTLNDDFPFIVPKSRQEWKERAELLRRRLLVSSGLWPMPTRTPLRSVIHGRTKRDGFTVEKVFFESYPGHFVTGLLFRPTSGSAPRPAVLSPHGHGGRLQDLGAEGVLKHIVQGAERFEGSGRFPKLSRCAQLARMGCVAFIYDMVGYADSVQISQRDSHRIVDPRPELDRPDGWGFFSTQAELRLQSLFGLQTYNSLRALDFLCSLPDVDPERVGVTGGSGGGTQTIVIGALDPRPIVAFPQGMVSTSMQGGCTCENASLLRIGTGNVELAALFAPKPQGMTAADDWTRDMMTKGYPQLQALYELYGAKEHVFCKSLVHFPHNYNYVTRALMYSWFNKYMNLGLKEPIVEEDYKPLSSQEWTVWDAEHPPPSGGPDHEKSLTRWIDRDANRQIAALVPRDLSSLEEYRRVIGGALGVIVGRGISPKKSIARKKVSKEDLGEYFRFADVLRLDARGEEIPVLSFYPKEWNRQVVIWITGSGKAGLYDDTGSLRPEITSLLNRGCSVLTADLLYQGEFLDAGAAPLTQTPMVKTRRAFAGYTFGYNAPLFIQRVHDVLTLISFASHSSYQPDEIHVVGVRGAGPIAAAARTQAGDSVAKTAIDAGDFRFAALGHYSDVNFFPGAVKYGDLPGLLSLAAPHPLWIGGNSGSVADVIAACYNAAGSPGVVEISSKTGDDAALAAAAWIVSSDE